MANPRIVNYIVGEIQKSVPHDLIIKDLQENGGWKDEEIIEAFRSIGVNDTVISAKKKKSRLILVFVSVVIGVSLTVWAFLFVYPKFYSPLKLTTIGLTRMIEAKSLSFNLINELEVTVSREAIDQIFKRVPAVDINKSAGKDAKEVINLSLTIKGDTDKEGFGANSRMDLNSSRFLRSFRINGDFESVYQDRLFYLSVPNILAKYFRDIKEEDFDKYTKTVLDTSNNEALSFVNRQDIKRFFGLLLENNAFEFEDKGETFVGSDSVRDFKFSVNPYSVKFALRDLAEEIDGVYRKKFLKDLEQTVDYFKLEEGEIFITKRGEIIRIQLDLALSNLEDDTNSGSLKILFDVKENKKIPKIEPIEGALFMNL